MVKVKLITVICLTLTLSAHAAKKGPEAYHLPSLDEATFDDDGFNQQKKSWSKQNRKLASNMSFMEADLSGDFKKIRDEWLKVSNADQMEKLLHVSHEKYESYSADTKYFLAQMHTVIPLRGIIWRLRPLFENNKGFLGNKATHVAAVQAVRGAVSSLSMFLPTGQSDAGVQYFLEPSKKMSKDDQFQSVTEVQDFLIKTFIPVLNEAIGKISKINKAPEHSIFIWDNKMVFGTGTFVDEINRYTGHGPAEINTTLSALYRAYHDILVYCAYNQDRSLKVAGQLGKHFGVDSGIFSSKKSDMGITDKERVGIIKSAADKHRFLELRNYKGVNNGTLLMKEAYRALKSSVVYAKRSYEYLQVGDASNSMVLNPILYQAGVVPNIHKGVANMEAVVRGPAEVRDPVSGSTVTINLPNFYNEPPQSLKVLMATSFQGGDSEKIIVNEKGEKLKVRNYFSGRSNGWDNKVWQKYVPSAAGQPANYMAEARRVIQYSLGTSAVFGLPDLFVH